MINTMLASLLNSKGKYFESAKNLILFAALNFGPLLGFYIINHFWGFKVGILVSVLLVFVEFTWLKYKTGSIGGFFYLSSGIIVLFGIADLIYQDPFFLKYEAVFTNLTFAVFFGASLLKQKPIVQVIVESQKRTSSDSSPDQIFFFRAFTILWSFYFLAKTVLYLWLSLNSSLEEIFIVRLIVGKLSFCILIFVSVGIPDRIWKMMEFFGLFPSQR